MTEYERGYQQALKDINRKMAPIMNSWEPSSCPNCNKSFANYEECCDGYYKRADDMERCPFCGQALQWWEEDAE